MFWYIYLIKLNSYFLFSLLQAIFLPNHEVKSGILIINKNKTPEVLSSTARFPRTADANICFLCFPGVANLRSAQVQHLSLSPSMAFKVWRNIQDVSLVANLMAEGLTWDHLNDTEGNLVLTLDCILECFRMF